MLDVVGEVTGEVSVGVGGCELMCRVVVMMVMSPLLDVGRGRGVEEEEDEADMMDEFSSGEVRFSSVPPAAAM